MRTAEWIGSPAGVEHAKDRECIFYVTMSEMSQMSKLKNHITSERSKIFKNGQMRKVAQNLQHLRKNFQKIEK